MSSRVCEICNGVMTNDDQLVECCTCNELYHRDCFEELGGCANPKCENYRKRPLSLYELSHDDDELIYENEDDYLDEEKPVYENEDDYLDEDDDESYSEVYARSYSTYEEEAKGVTLTNVIAFLLAGLFIAGVVIGALRLF